MDQNVDQSPNFVFSHVNLIVTETVELYDTSEV